MSLFKSFFFIYFFLPKMCFYQPISWGKLTVEQVVEFVWISMRFIQKHMVFRKKRVWESTSKLNHHIINGSVIIYLLILSSCFPKPVWYPFFCLIQKQKLWRMCLWRMCAIKVVHMNYWQYWQYKGRESVRYWVIDFIKMHINILIFIPIWSYLDYANIM